MPRHQRCTACPNKMSCALYTRTKSYIVDWGVGGGAQFVDVHGIVGHSELEYDPQGTPDFATSDITLKAEQLAVIRGVRDRHMTVAVRTKEPDFDAGPTPK